MIRDVLLGVGLVAVIEGLALAPDRIREALDVLARLDPDRRRLLGLLAMTVGIALVWAARA